eukprot:6568656-Prymnesium_polylepis.1
MAEAMSGEGIDRHLMGLQIAHATRAAAAMAEARAPPPLPRIFSHALYRLGASWELSTSHLPIEHSRATGFHPVVAHGIGVTYQVFPHRMAFTVSADATCETTDSAAFCDELARVLPMLRALLSEASVERGAEAPQSAQPPSARL